MKNCPASSGGTFLYTVVIMLLIAYSYICFMLFFNYSGKLFKEDIAVIGAANRGLRYGDGLFETIKFQNNKLILADEHFARLWKGMSILHFEIPKHLTAEKLQQEIFELIKKNGFDNSVRVRLTVIRGDGSLYDAVNHLPNYIIETSALDNGNAYPKISSLNSNGLVLGICTEVNKSCDILSNLKHNNYLPYVMAAYYAKNQKWNDAIILNSEGRICDSTIANIFLIKDEHVYTPALEEGCVAGVMRKAIIRQLKMDHWDVTEKQVSVDDLMNAGEVFLTNSIYDVHWVQRIADKEYSNTVTQKIYSSMLPYIS